MEISQLEQIIQITEDSTTIPNKEDLLETFRETKTFIEKMITLLEEVITLLGKID